MKLFSVVSFFSFAALSSALLAGQDSPTLSESRPTTRLPYEVVVTPTVTRTTLRRLIIEVEEDFVDRFNELNLDDYYDVLCYKHVPTGSHRSQKVCEPDFLIKTRGQNASDNAFMLAQGFAGARDAIVVLTPRMLKQRLKNEYVVLQEKVEELTRSDVELRSMGTALVELRNRLKDFGRED